MKVDVGVLLKELAGSAEHYGSVVRRETETMLAALAPRTAPFDSAERSAIEDEDEERLFWSMRRRAEARHHLHQTRRLIETITRLACEAASAGKAEA
jgi:hypothetical protein